MCFRRRGVGPVSQVLVQDFPRGALLSMVHCDVQVSSDVHHNTRSVAGRCRRSATRKIARRIAVARVRLLLQDYKRCIVYASILGRALPEKKSVKYSVTLGDGVSANRLNIIDDGQVLIEPRCWAACSGDMAAALALAAIAVS